VDAAVLDVIAKVRLIIQETPVSLDELEKAYKEMPAAAKPNTELECIKQSLLEGQK